MEPRAFGRFGSLPQTNFSRRPVSRRSASFKKICVKDFVVPKFRTYFSLPAPAAGLHALHEAKTTCQAVNWQLPAPYRIRYGVTCTESTPEYQRVHMSGRWPDTCGLMSVGRASLDFVPTRPVALGLVQAVPLLLESASIRRGGGGNLWMHNKSPHHGVLNHGPHNRAVTRCGSVKRLKPSSTLIN